MNKILLFLSLSITGVLTNHNSCNDTKDYLVWSDSRKLVWKDFEGIKKDNDITGAESSIQLLLDYKISDKKEFKVLCVFLKRQSWYRIDSIDVLNHEQGHFDIGEIVARQLRKKIIESISMINAYNGKKILDSLFREYEKNLGDLQAEYDIDTHSRSKKQQEVWDYRIQEGLDSLVQYEKQSYKF